MKKRIALTLLALAVLAGDARADQPSITITPPPLPEPSFPNRICGPQDPTCKDHLQSFLGDPTIRVLPVQVEGGVTFGGAGATGAAISKP
jgi:hypothetical protein